MPFTRQDWNDLLHEVNEVLENPPEDTDCEAIEPIPDVDPLHRWSKEDIQEVHDKIKETCDEITFEEIPELWEQATVDEIREKLGEAWCDCEDDDDDEECDRQVGRDEHGTLFIIAGPIAPRVYSNCFNDYEIGEDPTVPIQDLIEGFPIGLPGYTNRSWVLQRRRSTTSTVQVVASGPVRADGTVDSLVSIATVAGHPGDLWGDGVRVTCFSDCETSSSCQTALANAAANVADGGFADFTYTLFLNSYLALCEE